MDRLLASFARARDAPGALADIFDHRILRHFVTTTVLEKAEEKHL